MTYSQWEYGLTLTGDERSSSMTWLKTDLNCNFACADPEGGKLEYDMAQNRPKLQFCMCGSRGGDLESGPP